MTLQSLDLRLNIMTELFANEQLINNAIKFINKLFLIIDEEISE